VSARARGQTAIWSTLVVSVLAFGACTTFDGEAFINRRAVVLGDIRAEDGRVGVPCTTKLLLGGQAFQEPEPASSGATFRRDLAFLTPVRIREPFAPEFTLIVRCEGYSEQKSAPFKVEPAWPTAPEVNVGTITVSSARPVL
jgi:hypothetical protein